MPDSEMQSTAEDGVNDEVGGSQTLTMVLLLKSLLQVINPKPSTEEEQMSTGRTQRL
jgi:hypothetical protein